MASEVTEESQVGHVRRLVNTLCASAELDAGLCGRAAIIATEAARNIVRHARRGLVVLSTRTAASGPYLDILALDRGPGMPDIAACLRDGYSTAGTAGTGLGAIQRLSTHFDIWSTPGLGTAIWSRLCSAPHCGTTPQDWVDIGGFSLAKPGQIRCGDAWDYTVRPGRATILLCDGLGHGPEAAAAADAAVSFFARSDLPPDELLRQLHPHLRGLRGAAAAAIEFAQGGETLRYAAVGNIAGVLVHPKRRTGLVSQYGTVGVNLPAAVRVDSYPFPLGTVLLLWSDGVTSQANLDGYPGVQRRRPALAAGLLLRDYRRGNDDATCVVVKRRA